MSDTITISLRLPRELHESLVQLAAAEQRSLNGQILYLLRRETTPEPPPTATSPAQAKARSR